MSVVFGIHVLKRIPERGTTVAEVEDVLRSGDIDKARPGYAARAKVFAFGRLWAGKAYPEKRVRVIYVGEGDTTVVVTVYVYYGSWSK